MTSKAQTRVRWQTWLAVVTTLVLGACQPAADTGKTTQTSQATTSNQTLRIGYIGPSETAGGAVGWALHQGSLQAAVQPLGFAEVKEYVFPNGPDLNEALLSNQLDIGIFGDTPALTGEANRGGSTLIGFNSVANEAWLMGRPEIKQLADLTGKNIGVPNGSYMYRYVSGLIEQGLLKDVKLKFLLPRDAQAALSNGDIAAFAAPIQLGPQLQSLNFNTVDLASSHQLQGNSVIVARDGFLSQNPQFFKVFDQTRRAAAEDLRQQPDAYYAYYLQHTQYKEPIIRASFPMESFNTDTFPAQGLKLLEGTKQFLLSQKIINKDFAIQDWQIKTPS